MNDSFQIPNFGAASDTYERRHIDTITRALVILLKNMQSPGTVRANTMNISNLPTSDTDLLPGDLWNDGGTVKIVT